MGSLLSSSTIPALCTASELLYDGLGEVEDADQVDHVDVDDVSDADGDDVRKASTINTLILSQYDGDDENIQNFHHHPHNPRHCPIKKNHCPH